MPGLIIVAHAPLASALQAVAQHAFPECTARLQAFDVPPDMSAADIEAQLRERLAQVAQPDAVILTDVFGATPCNVAQRLADGVHVRVVTGVNVPMLWRSLCYRDEPLESLVNRAVAGAGQGVMSLGSCAPQNQVARSIAHAESHAHHQQ